MARKTRFRMTVGGLLVIAACAAWVVVAASAQDERPPVPNPPGAEAKTPEQLYAQLPDRIPVSFRDRPGVAGSISKDDYLADAMAGADIPPDEPRPTPEPIAVLDANGELVGHFYPGTGFVSLQESDQPGFDAARLAPPTTVSDPRAP